jgi:hypothetical protein
VTLRLLFVSGVPVQYVLAIWTALRRAPIELNRRLRLHRGRRREQAYAARENAQ